MRQATSQTYTDLFYMNEEITWRENRTRVLEIVTWWGWVGAGFQSIQLKFVPWNFADKKKITDEYKNSPLNLEFLLEGGPKFNIQRRVNMATRKANSK